MATIRYQPDVADRAALVGAIEAAGYDVRDGRPPASATPPTSPAELADGFAADDARARARARALLVRGRRLDRRRRSGSWS